MSAIPIQKTAEKGQPNGYAGLDADGNVLDGAGEVVGGAGGVTTVVLDAAILPDGITASAPFGYVTDGSRVTFFGQLTADGTSDGSVGNVPFLPLTLAFPTTHSAARAYFAVTSNPTPPLVFPDVDGLWANSTLGGSVQLGGITFAGTVSA